jgi:hypothetical protein
MTNLKSVFGATMWMALNVLMLFAALEPITTTQPQPAELAARPGEFTAA